MQDDLRDGLGENQSDGLRDNSSEPELTMQSEIPSLGEIMQAPRDMLINAIQQNTELHAQNAEPMEGNREYPRE